MAVQALRCKTWVMMPLSKTEVHVGVHKKIKIKIAELEKLVDQKQMLLNNINSA